MTNHDVNTDDLREGKLYKYEDGILIEIQTDPSDTMKRVKIIDFTFDDVLLVQSKMRRSMNGYRPDIHLVCSALVQYGAIQKNADEIVKDYIRNLV